jgi:cobalamin biosynthesis protein CobD/CbiB
VAENSPETIEDAIIEFKKNISPLFRSLNYEIGTAMQSLSKDAKSIDVMLQRERMALDSIILRERIALSTKADALVETGIENVFEGLIATLRKLIVYFILLFLTVLGLPFYLGYLTGKRKSK